MDPRRLLVLAAAIAAFLLAAVPAEARVMSGRAAADTARLGNLEVAPASIDFGIVDNASRPVTLRNAGTSPLQIQRVEINSGIRFRVSPFSGTLAAGQSVTITVSTKSAFSGAAYDSLVIVTDQYGPLDDDPDAGKLFIPLSAEIVNPDEQFLAVESSSVSLPTIEVGESTTVTVTVLDTGGGMVSRVSPPTFSDPSLTAPGFPSPYLAVPEATGRASFTVRWAPTAPGALNATTILRSDWGIAQVSFTGVAVLPPALSSSPVVFPDTSVGATTTSSVSVSNTGGPATIASVELEAGATNVGAADFAVTSKPTQIAAGGSGTFSFAFAPAAVGARSASALVIDQRGRTLLRIPLSGTSRGPVPQVQDRLNFGSVRTGGSVTRALVIANVGDADLPLDSLSVQGPAGPFSVSGDRSPVPAGGTRTVSVRFAPSADGAVSGSLALQVAGLPATTVDLSGVGSSSLPLEPVAGLPGGGGVPTDVDTGDVDEDGQTDAVIGFAATGEVRFARGLGDGGFAAPVAIGGTGAAGALDLAVGDVNEDGHLDVVAAGAVGSKVLRGAGDGSFSASAPALAADEVALADFDDDGHLDLVGTLSSASVLSAVRRMTGVGDGSFTGPVTSRLEGVGTGVAVADLQRDGDMDYVLSWALSDGTTGIRLGINDGTGAAAGNVPVVEAGGVAVGQFDGGLLPDVSVGGKLLLNLATPPVDGGTRGDVVRVADFDGDGRDDQVTAKRGEVAVSLSLGNGTGGFMSTVDVGTDAPGSAEPADLAVGDLNGDGRPDVLGALGGEELTVLLNASSPSGSGAGKALITEARFGGDGYVQVMNTSRTADLSLDGWQLRFGGGRTFAFPAGTRLAPRGTTLVTSAVRGAAATWSLQSVVRGLVGVPASATGVMLVDRRGAGVDAAGLTSAPAGFREGAGLPVTTFRGQGAFVRKVVAGAWTDTGQNAADFRAVDTAAQAGDSTVLGAPRPDRPSDPTNRNDILQSSLIDPSKPASAAPNREVVDGKLVIRRVLTNCSGGLTTGACLNADPNAPAVAVKRVRFRITDLSTVGTSTGAILKAVSLGSSGGYTQGITLGAPSASTGGGINATLTPRTSALLGAGLLPGSSFEVEFAFTVERGGAFRFGYDTEDDLELLPKPVASPAAEEKVPEAPPVPEKVNGTAPTPQQASGEAAVAPQASAPMASTSAAVPSAKAPTKAAAAKKKAKCVTRSQRSKLRGKARAKAKLCTTKKRPATSTGKAKR